MKYDRQVVGYLALIAGVVSLLFSEYTSPRVVTERPAIDLLLAILWYVLSMSGKIGMIIDQRKINIGYLSLFAFVLLFFTAVFITSDSTSLNGWSLSTAVTLFVMVLWVTTDLFDGMELSQNSKLTLIKTDNEEEDIQVG